MKVKFSIAAVCLIGGLVMVSFVKPNEDYFAITKNIDIFATLFKEVNAFYVDEVDPEELMNVGIDAMLNSLDPYTVYISESELEAYKSLTTGEYAGVGITILKLDNLFYVDIPREDGPAFKNGLNSGDQIVAIDGNVLEGKQTFEISTLLKGEAGTLVELEVKGLQDEVRKLKFNRERISIDNVSFVRLLENNTGYIKLSDFTTGAGVEVENALNRLKAEGATKLVLDLRGNPGGLLNEAINVAGVFLNKKTEIVSTKGKVASWNKVYKSLNEPADTEMPLVVLVNGQSASASEIVSGVIQDYDRGVLIGSNTFGKGLVQTTRPLKFNAKLKVTAAKYYIPSGRCIQAINYASDDSLRNYRSEEFKTKNGRAVWSGNGLQPDIVLERGKSPGLIQQLQATGQIFKYASVYCAGHEKPKSGMDINLGTSDYKEFITWLNQNDFVVKTDLDEAISDFKTEIQEEFGKQVLQEQVGVFENFIEDYKGKEFEMNKEEILKALNIEVARRYFNESGGILAGLKNDEGIQRALELLNKEEAYSAVLENK